jgi:predicted branched-subunit amino acid permease
MTDSTSIKQLKEFGYLIGFVFPVLIGWLLPALFGHGFRVWTLWVAIPGVILGLVAPELLRQPYRAWMALGHVLGFINSHVILGLVFIIVLQPTAYLMRVLGHDPLRRRKLNCNQSYREVRSKLDINFNRLF